MSCHEEAKPLPKYGSEDLKILLMGNPNVGKSVIFSKLTVLLRFKAKREFL